MNRRSLLTLLPALSMLGPSGLFAPAALAEDGDESSDDSSDDGGEDSGDEAGDDAGGDDSGDDSSGGDGSGGDAENGSAREDDHDDALRAVTDNGAVPLQQILKQFQRLLDGTVVDVTLIRNTDELRYRVKYIDTAGRVRRAYFDALTGALVQ